MSQRDQKQCDPDKWTIPSSLWWLVAFGTIAIVAFLAQFLLLRLIG